MNDLYIKASKEPWVRPADWLPIDHLVDVGDEKFVGLFAVFSDRPNIIAITSEQSFTVDWGDGTVINYSASAIAEKEYDFSLLSSSTQTSEGFRQVIIQAYPQTAPLSGSFNFCTQRTTKPNLYTTNYLDIRVSFPNTSSIAFTPNNILHYLRKWVHVGTHNNYSFSSRYIGSIISIFVDDFTKMTSTSSMFAYTRGTMQIGDIVLTGVSGTIDSMFQMSGIKSIGNTFAPSATSAANFCHSAYKLETVGNFSAPNAISTNSLFLTCSNLQSVGDLNIPLSTTTSAMFTTCLSLKTVGVINIQASSTIASLFFQCSNLETIGNITSGAALTTIQQAFQGCSKLKGINISNCSNVTNTTNAFLRVYSLETLILTGLTRGFTLPACKMNESAWIDLFNSLGTASGSQTIVITGNITLLPSTIAIATGKGFTVTP